MASSSSSPPSAKRAKLEVIGLQLGPLPGPLNGVCWLRSVHKRYDKTYGKGEVFSFVLQDVSGEIRVSVFGNNLGEVHASCDNGRAITIAGAKAVPENRQYNLVDNPLELTVSIGKGGVVTACTEVLDVSEVHYNFVHIQDLANVGFNKVVDAIGVIVKTTYTPAVLTQRGGNVNRGTVNLVDQSGRHVVCTFWGNSSDEVQEWQNGNALALKGAKTTTFSGLSLNATSARVYYKPTSFEATELRDWYADHADEADSFPAVLAEAGEARPRFPLVLTYPPNITAEHVRQWSEVHIRVQGTTFVFVPAGQRPEQESGNQ